MARTGLVDWLRSYGVQGQGETIVRAVGTDSEKAQELEKLLKRAGAQGIGVNRAQVHRWRRALAQAPGIYRETNQGPPRAKRPRGGQLGNKNATGHGAPRGNRNALKHGAYSVVYLMDLAEQIPRPAGVAPGMHLLSIRQALAFRYVTGPDAKDLPMGRYLNAFEIADRCDGRLIRALEKQVKVGPAGYR